MINEQAHLDELRALYGEEYPYSDYKRGQQITYHSPDTGHIKTEVIEWVAAAGRTVSGNPVPARYIVGFDVVYFSEVLEATSQEPTLVHCPWCGQYHDQNSLDHCPLKRKQQP